MKKISALLLSLLLMFNLSVCIGLNVEASSAVKIDLTVGNPYMSVNGNYMEIDPGNGTAPVVVGGRTLVPVRAIVEALGGKVSWEENSQMVMLTLGSDKVSMFIGSTTALRNDTVHYLDVAPDIINNRTMLPIRFVAESFNFGVQWNDATQTVTINANASQNTALSGTTYQQVSAPSFNLSAVPSYSGSPYAVVNGNVPYFSPSDYTTQSYEKYSPLDSLGRCGVCIANISLDIMPTSPRGDISSVKPTGWHSMKYSKVDGGYLYNRCHLIGFQLTAENANANNLITGTRYMNVEGMLPFENMVADYIKETGNHVLYRATPVFEGSNLVASGVLLEAYSVEDSGAGICFNVYCYNVQPEITINYATGSSQTNYSAVKQQPAPQVQQDTYQPAQPSPAPAQPDVYYQPSQNQGGSYSSQSSSSHPYGYYILNNNSKKYHEPSCGSARKISDKNKSTSTLSSAELRAQGYTPCGNCDPQ